MTDSDRALAALLDRIERRADEMYLLALARIYKVDPRTVLIWRITGRV